MTVRRAVTLQPTSRFRIGTYHADKAESNMNVTFRARLSPAWYVDSNSDHAAPHQGKEIMTTRTILRITALSLAVFGLTGVALADQRAVKFSELDSSTETYVDIYVDEFGEPIVDGEGNYYIVGETELPVLAEDEETVLIDAATGTMPAAKTVSSPDGELSEQELLDHGFDAETVEDILTFYDRDGDGAISGTEARAINETAATNAAPGIRGAAANREAAMANAAEGRANAASGRAEAAKHNSGAGRAGEGRGKGDR